MKTLAMGSAWLGAGAIAVMTTVAPQPASAFFDDLARAIFTGVQPVPNYRYVERYEPREFRRQPRQRVERVERVERVSAPSTGWIEQSSKPAPPVVDLDPSTDKNWYLKDPTLRKGDIVVTANGPMVFQGRTGDQHRKTAFVSLEKTGKLSRDERQIVAAAAEPGWR